MLGVATGARLNKDTLDRDLDALKSLSCDAIRWYPNRSMVDAGDGFNWTFPDAVVAGCDARDMDVLLGVSLVLDGHACDPSQADPLARYAAALAHRYALDPRVCGFEGPNEIMLGWKGSHPKYDPEPTPTRYLPLQRAMYEAIKDVEPGALVGLASQIGDSDWLAGFYAAGGKPFFDFVPDHPYCKPLSPTEVMAQGHGGWAAMIDRRHVMRSNGDGHKPTWVTEFGTNTGGHGAVSEALQASDLDDALHRWKRHPWAGPFFVFCGWDADDPSNDPGDSMGLLRADRTQKPAAQVFRAAAA